MSRGIWKGRRSLRNGLWIATIFVGFVLLALVGFTLSYSNQLDETNQEVRQQFELNARIRQLQKVSGALRDAELAQRDYLLNDQAAELQPYLKIEQGIPGLLDTLQPRAGERSELAAQLMTIRQLAVLKIKVLTRAADLHQAGRHAEALRLLNTDAGLDEALGVHGELERLLRRLLLDRDKSVVDMASDTLATRKFVNWMLVAIALSVFVVGLLVVQLIVAERGFATELAQSEARHRAYLEDQQELVAFSRPDGTLVYANASFARAFGAAPDEVIGRSLFDFVAPADLRQVRALIERVVLTGEPGRGENRMKNAEDQHRWISWSNVVQRGADGELLIHSVGRDITDRRQAEDALRASEEFLTRTGRVAGVGGWEVDLRTSRVKWSDQVRRIHEVDDAFMPTRESGVSFYEPDARARIAEASRAGIEDGTPFDLELPLITARGQRRFVRSVGEVERDANGVPVRIVGALQDVTERRRLEEHVAASERFLRQITDNLPLRVSYLDIEGRYRFANAAQQRRIGLPMSLILGRKRSALMQGPQELAVKRCYDAALRGQPQHHVYEETIGDETLITESQWIPDVGPDGQVTGVYAISIDVTAQQTAAWRLRELSEILEQSTDLIAQSDREGRLQYLNPAACRALGLVSGTSLVGQLYSDLLTEETLARYVAEITPTARAQGIWIGETTVLLDGGHVTPVNHMVIAHRDGDGRISHFSSVMRDISEQVAARKALRQQAATLEAIVESVPAMVAVFDVDLRYLVVNRAFERWRGRRRIDVIGRGLAELFGQEEYDRSLPWAQRALAGETVSYEKSYPAEASNQHLSINYAPLRVEDGSVVGIVAVAHDITMQRNEEKRLLSLAERDALTGVLNRVGFHNHLAGRGDGPTSLTTALLYIDLDHFKPVNDTHGHVVGDELLRQFAERVRSIVRPGDAVARLGGDEFAVVLDDVRTQAHADAVADKIVEAAKLPFTIGQARVTVGASVGVAHGLQSIEGWQGLVKRADEALYRAKAAGRGRRA